jgi:hypothetical protein
MRKARTHFVMVLVLAVLMLSACAARAERDGRYRPGPRRVLAGTVAGAYQPDHVPDLAVHPRGQHLRGPKQRQLVRLRLHAGSGHGVRRWRRRRYRLSRAISPAGPSLGGCVAVMARRPPADGVALFPQNRQHVLIRMDLSDAELQQRAPADRWEVEPPIQVEAATWSKLASSIGG